MMSSKCSWRSPEGPAVARGANLTHGMLGGASSGGQSSEAAAPTQSPTHGHPGSDAGGAADTDPLALLRNELGACSNAGELRALLHPPQHLEGFEGFQEARETIWRWFEDILADERCHRSIGADPAFSLRGLVPVPFERALARVSAKEGWPAESLLNAMFTNIGWLEHHHTRLVVHHGEEDGRSPNIPCFHGMGPATRKSSLKQYCSSTLLDVEEAPEFIRDGRATCANGTARGVCTSIVHYRRSGIVSDEVGNTSERGRQYLGRSRLAAYVLCERDTQITANGPSHLAGYSFVHHAWGQVPAVEYALRPAPGGFQKRFHIVFPGATECESDLQCAHSKAFLLDFHRWMCRHALPEARHGSFDACALALFHCVRGAIADFIGRAPGLGALDIAKLQFADTDLLRMTNAIMRCTAFAEGQSGISPAEQPSGGFHARQHFSLLELVYAIRLWKRQLCLHFGYHRSSQRELA